jgi:integrase-like protein
VRGVKVSRYRRNAEIGNVGVDALSARDDGVHPTPAKETVSTFLDAWLEVAQSSLRPRTLVSYTQISRDHLKPALGRTPLTRLQPQQAQQLYARLKNDGRARRQSGTCTSPSTAR